MTIFNFNRSILVILGVLLALTSCAPHLGGSDYAVSDVGSIGQTLKGVIIAARVIKIRPNDAEKMGTGATVGAVTGTAVGTTLGGSPKGSLLAGAFTGLAGGVAGHMLEKKLTEQDGMEYQIKLTDGSIITLAQGIEPRLAVGTKVLVIHSTSGQARSRVIVDNS